MAVDLLADDASAARRIVDEFEPSMTRQEYLAYQRGVMREERWGVQRVVLAGPAPQAHGPLGAGGFLRPNGPGSRIAPDPRTLSGCPPSAR